MFKHFEPNQVCLTKYLFYTGKGGAGKTSMASATALKLAETGKKVFLISTDPASNLQDLFQTKLTNQGVAVKSVPNLIVANLNPLEAAAEYRESVVAPYRNKLPEDAIRSMEEQLSGSCAVEVAALNVFTHFITNEDLYQEYDYIIFDTAPTGHTLRLLKLPSEWDSFIHESSHGASCLGQLSELKEQRNTYRKAVENLQDQEKTTIFLVSRPELTSLEEADKTLKEINRIGIKNQILLINGILEKRNKNDKVANCFFRRQKEALDLISDNLKEIEILSIPLRTYNISDMNSLRRIFEEEAAVEKVMMKKKGVLFPGLVKMVRDLKKKNKKVIFTMGKGGVGKTTVAIEIARELSKYGKKVYFTTTDPAGYMSEHAITDKNIEIIKLDEKEELEKYKRAIIEKAEASNLRSEELDYLIEELKSPCIQELALFKAFAEQIEKSRDGVVVIDTASTGHTLLLLNSTESYFKEMKRSNADIPDSMVNLLPRLQNHEETEVVIVALPEPTPVFEALRLENDLKREGIRNKWWVMNASFLATETIDPTLRSRARKEEKWIQLIAESTSGDYAVIPWEQKINHKAKNSLKGA